MLSWFKNLKVAQKIVSVIILAAIFISIVGYTGYYFANKNAQATTQMYKDKALPIGYIYEALSLVNNNKANLFQIYAAVITNKQDRVQSILKQIDEETAKFQGLEKKYKETNLDAKGREQIQQLEGILESYLVKRKICIDYLLKGDTRGGYEYFLKQEAIFSQFETKLQEMAQHQTDSAEQLNSRAASDTRFGTTVVVMTILMAIIICVSLGLMIANMIAKSLENMLKSIQKDQNGNIQVKEVKVESTDEVGQLGITLNELTSQVKTFVNQVAKTVESLTTGSEEMNAAAEQTANGAQQVSVSVTQLASGSQEQANNVARSVNNITAMNQIIQKIYQNATNVVNLAADAETGAQKGSEQADKAVIKINQIKNTASETAKTANNLGILGTEIEQIVDLIKGIAGQTNLLALNAAIEAARAGEHGKGFAVVAEEVKKLAGQSADATGKITDIVKQVQSMTKNVVDDMDKGVKEIEEGVVTIDNVGKLLQEILTVAQTVNTQAAEVSQISDGLAKTSEEVVGMMEGISSITEETASQSEEIASITEEQTASVEEISANAQSLVKIAENLQKQVAVFKI